MTWDQIRTLAGTDRRTLQRLGNGERTFITRHLHDRVAAALRTAEAVPDPTSVHAVLVPSTHASWMVGALLAVGWSSAWIGQQVGWTGRLCTTDFNPKVHIATLHRIEDVFRSYHWRWGPTRRTAVGQWRKGRFPADCYDWDREVPDHRPIPGSLHPDLVAEAARFAPASSARTERVLADMRGWGQWPDARCARTSMRLWAEAVGAEVEDYSDVQVRPGRSVWCRSRWHDHSPPDCWNG